MAALFCASSTNALEPLNEGGTPRSDCRNVPDHTEVRLDWARQNLAGCKVQLSSTRSRIERLNSDCVTSFVADVPPDMPRTWTILSQPAGANAQVTATSDGARLTLSLAGAYAVQLTVCPAGDCQAFEYPGALNPFPVQVSSGTIVGWAVHRNRPVRIPDNATFSFNLSDV